MDFHGGGYLKNSHGFIMKDYIAEQTPTKEKYLGSGGIQGGLLKIVNAAFGKNDKKDDSYVIDLLLDAGTNYYVKEGKVVDDPENWMWDLSENLRVNEARRIKLPDEVREYYEQFKPGWKISTSENGLNVFMAEHGTETNPKPHSGEDWIYTINNRNMTVGQPLYSPISGIVDEIKNNR